MSRLDRSPRFLQCVVIGLGLVTGGGVVWAPGFAFMLALLAAVGLVLSRRTAPEDRRFLVRLYTAAIGARIVIGGLLHVWAIYRGLGWVRYGTASFDLFGDSAWASLQGWLNAQTWLGQLERAAADTTILTISEPERRVYLYAAFHWLFGFSQFSVKLIGALCGVMTAVLAYALVKDLAGRLAATAAAVLVAFFPSTLLWSVTNLKDTPNSLGVIWGCWAFLQCLRRGWRITFFLHLLGAMGVLYLARPAMVLAILVSCLLAVGWSVLCRPWGRRLLAALAMMTVVGLSLMPKHVGLQFAHTWRQRIESTLGQLVMTQAGQALSVGSAYHLYPERFYEYNNSTSPRPPTLTEVVGGVVKGWGYFLLAPAPWAIATLLQVATAPEMILWYVLLVFAIRGIWRGMRAAPAEVGTLVIWIVILSSLNALTTGNMGVAFRHRSMVIPLVLSLSAIGLLPMEEGTRRSRATTVPVV